MDPLGAALLEIRIEDSNLERVRLLLERYPERLIAAMERANKKSGAALLRRIKEKLSNDVLRVRTGNLRRNWAQIMPVREADGWRGGVGSGRTDYAAAHEFGVDRVIPNVAVRAHARRQDSRNTYRKSAANYRRGGTGVVLAAQGVAFVRAFTRNQHVKLPARPYARPALAETTERIDAIHKDEIRQAWEKVK